MFRARFRGRSVDAGKLTTISLRAHYRLAQMIASAPPTRSLRCRRCISTSIRRSARHYAAFLPDELGLHGVCGLGR